MRSHTRLVLLLVLILIISACGSNVDNANGSSGSPDNDWLEKAALDESESIEELYEKAKEEGELTLYTIVSITPKIKEAFEAEFEGVELKGGKVSSSQIVDKVIEEHEADIYEADVLLGKGSNGEWDEELLKKGYIHEYRPADVMDGIMEPYRDITGLPITVEFDGLFYNEEAFDEPPIDNWWDLTTEEWRGNVTIQSPLASAGRMEFFLGFVHNADDMAKAYKEKFGEEIELDGTENAGYEFIKRLMENDVIIRDSAEEVIQAVGESTDKDDPLVAIGPSNKLYDRENQNFPILLVDEMMPKVGPAAHQRLFIADNAPNPNAAKLFIKWLASGGEGFEPFNTPGTFPAMTNVDQNFDIISPIDEIDLWNADPEFYYNEIDNFREFFITHE